MKLLAGSSAAVPIAAGKVLRMSGIAQIYFGNGQYTTVNGGGSVGPFSSSISVTITASSDVSYSIESEQSGPVSYVVNDEGDLVGLRNRDGTSVKLQSNQPTQYYRFLIPGRQFVTSGVPRDYSGNSANGVFLASLSDAAAWANSGYLTTAVGANAGVRIPKSQTEFNLGTQSIIFACLMNKPVPAGADVLFAVGDSAASQGCYLSVRTNGKLRPIINTAGSVGGSAVTGLADSAAVFCDSTPHAVLLAIDAVTKNVYLYRDGSLSDTYASAYAGDTASRSTDFYIGVNAGGTSFEASKIGGIHFMVFDGGLPTNVLEIAARHASMPYQPISEMDIYL